MTKKVRTIIFYAFALLFLVSAPLLLLYTAGYRYNLDRGRLEQVGALLIRSLPKGAVVTVNNRVTGKQTPALLELAPNEYQIVVSKDGYRSWEKRLEVRSRETTFAEDIVLWKEVAPRALRKTEHLVDAVFAPDLRSAVLLDIREEYPDVFFDLIYFDLLFGNETVVKTFASAARGTITLSPSGTSVLVRTEENGKSKFTVIPLPTGQSISLETITSRSFENITWAETDGALAGIDRGALHTTNLFTGRTDAIAQVGSSYILRGIKIWSVVTDDNRSLLAMSRAGAPREVPTPMSVLPAGTYRILPAPSPYLILHEETRDRILIIDERRPTEIIVSVPGAEIETRQNRNGELELLAWNTFEIWRANAVTGSTELVRRQSAPITDVAWSPRGEYLLFASRNTVHALELDNRDERNISELVSFTDHRIEELAVDPRGTLLYFTTTDGPESGLYSLELQ